MGRLFRLKVLFYVLIILIEVEKLLHPSMTLVGKVLFLHLFLLLLFVLLFSFYLFSSFFFIVDNGALLSWRNFRLGTVSCSLLLIGA